jgi:acetylornithine deacetylase/succinyl-diaminopimelate desuccinylase-like protein
MRILIALGGNALLRRSDPMTTEVQRRNILVAARAIAPLATEPDAATVLLYAHYDLQPPLDEAQWRTSRSARQPLPAGQPASPWAAWI